MTSHYKHVLTATGVCLGLLAAGMAQASVPPVVRPVVPAGTSADLVQAADLINARDLGSASEVLTKAYAADPNNPMVLYLDAVAQFDGGKYRTAYKEATMAMAIDRTVAAYWYLQGVSIRYDPDIWDLNVLRGSSADFTQAIALDPNFGDAYRERSAVSYYLYKMIPYSTGAYDGPSYQFDIIDALSRNPGDGEAHYLAGVENMWQETWPAIHDDLSQAIADGVTRSEVYENLGYVDAKLGNRTQAIADYRQAVAIDPANATAQANLAALSGGGGELTLGTPVVDPWVDQMRQMYGKYLIDNSDANAIAEGGDVADNSGRTREEIEEDDEDDGGHAHECARASAWWADLHDAVLTLNQLIATARSDDDKKSFSDQLPDAQDSEARALQNWHDHGCS